jgi:hypothetical protein
MYSVTHQDRPRELAELPQSSVGAPCPMLVAGEHSLRLAYYLEDVPPGWDGTTVRVVSEDAAEEPCALVSFKGAYAHMFGPPNDEAFSGHPLAERGLRPYAVFEVEQSSWLRQLERMNSVHPYHRPEHFGKYKHYVFAFHDTTFECIAESFAITLHRGNVWSVVSSAREA